jgi:hypothetical protein
VSDRLQEIRGRVAAWDAAKRIGGDVPRDALVMFGDQAARDMEWLLEQVEELTKRVRMYEVVKS